MYRIMLERENSQLFNDQCKTQVNQMGNDVFKPNLGPIKPTSQVGLNICNFDSAVQRFTVKRP